jgi:hypothetical protein
VLPVTVLDLEEVAAVDAEDELEVAPEMWNGKEYWKMVESESSVILNP